MSNPVGTLGVGVCSARGTLGEGVRSARGTLGVGVVHSFDSPGPPPVIPAWSDYFNYAWDAADLALADDAPIASWVDLIAGKSLAQAVGASQPLYKTSVLGHPVVRFDGVADHLWTSDASLLLNGATAGQSAVLFLALTGTPDATEVPATWGSTTNISNSLGFRGTSATDIGWVRQTTGVGGSGIAVGGSGMTYVPAAINFIAITLSAGVFKIWHNGTLTYTSSAVGGLWDHDRFSIGGWLRNTFVVPADFDCFGLGLAFGAEAAALHTDPSAMFALAASEWS